MTFCGILHLTVNLRCAIWLIGAAEVNMMCDVHRKTHSVFTTSFILYILVGFSFDKLSYLAVKLYLCLLTQYHLYLTTPASPVLPTKALPVLPTEWCIACAMLYRSHTSRWFGWSAESVSGSRHRRPRPTCPCRCTRSSRRRPRHRQKVSMQGASRHRRLLLLHF